MDIERRALNDEERTEFSATALWKVDWKELVGFAALGGGFSYVDNCQVYLQVLRLLNQLSNGRKEPFFQNPIASR